MKVTIAVLQCISEKHGRLSCNETPSCTLCCATTYYFRMLYLSGHLRQKHYKKMQGRQRKKVFVMLSAVLKGTEKTYSFWNKSKYQSRFGHPELMYLLISLLAGSLAASPVQWIHSGTKRSHFLLWELDGRPTLWLPIQTASMRGWSGLWGDFESLYIELSSLPGRWQHKRGGGSKVWEWAYVNWQCWHHPRDDGRTLR